MGGGGGGGSQLEPYDCHSQYLEAHVVALPLERQISTSYSCIQIVFILGSTPSSHV